MKNEKNVLVDLKTYMGDYYVEAKCISINPMKSELLAVGANDPYIRIYDRRMIKPVKVSFYEQQLYGSKNRFDFTNVNKNLILFSGTSGKCVIYRR